MLPWMEQGDGLVEEKYVRLVDMLTKEGVYYLEGPHLCGFKNNWHSKDFVPHGNTNVTTTIASLSWLGLPSFQFGRVLALGF